MTGQSGKGLWYVRKDGRIRGPLPAGQITREILLGRMHDSDELSVDRENWRHLNTLPQLVPKMMWQVDTEEGRQQLLLARLREDERLRDRREPGNTPAATSLRQGDRRTVDSFDVVALHLSEASPIDKGSKDERNLLLPAALIMISLLILVMYLFL